jgi:flagellar hook-associated protein 2
MILIQTGKTYEDLVEEMSYNSKLDVNLEKVNNTDYRMIVKGTESGTANAVTISQSGTTNLGFNDTGNHVLTAQNMKATIDGIDYDVIFK